MLLPRNYDADTDKRYPVIYLFHGGGDEADFRMWHTMTAQDSDRSMLLDETADTEAIYVMPDISHGCWVWTPVTSGSGCAATGRPST